MYDLGDQAISQPGISGKLIQNRDDLVPCWPKDAAGDRESRMGGEHRAEFVSPYKLDQTLLPAWESLSEAEGKRAWAEGSAMSLEKLSIYLSNLKEPESAISS